MVTMSDRMLLLNLKTIIISRLNHHPRVGVGVWIGFGNGCLVVGAWL